MQLAAAPGSGKPSAMAFFHHAGDFVTRDDVVTRRIAIRREVHEYKEKIFRQGVVSGGLLNLLIQNPFSNASLVGFHLNCDRFRGITIRRKDVHSTAVSQSDRSKIAAPRQLGGDEVLTCYPAETCIELHWTVLIISSASTPTSSRQRRGRA